MQESWVPSLGPEDPLEKGMATHSVILAWEIPWTEEPGGLQSTGSQRVGHDGVTSLSLLFNLYTEYIMRNTGLKEAQAGIKIAGRNINNLRYADDTTLMAESEEELKSFLMKVKEESENVGLKLNIQKTKIMASSPITSDRFYFGGFKITADGDCSHEIKRCLLLGRKVMTNLDSIFKSRDITLPTKVRLVRAIFSQWSCMDVRVGL